MDFLADIAKRYGLPFALLVLAVWWLNSRLVHIETRLENCEADKFKIITDNNERSNAVIGANTIALDRNTEVLKQCLGEATTPKKRIAPLTARQGINKD